MANALSMLGGVIARELIVGQNHAALDTAVVRSSDKPDSVVKVFCALPSGEAVIIYA
jgi:hypothetical protein